MIIFFILGVVIILLLIVIIVRVNNASDSVGENKTNFQDLKTGDLLFVRYNNSLGYTMRFLSGSVWTHVSMVYKDELGNIYVLETANYPRKIFKNSKSKFRGVLFMPIEEWRRYNINRQVSVMKLKAPKTFDRELLIENFEKVSDRNLDTFSVNWLRLLFKNKYKNNQLNNNITCYELIVYLLQETDVCAKDFTPSSFYPSDIINGKLTFNEGFSYKTLSKIEF